MDRLPTLIETRQLRALTFYNLIGALLQIFMIQHCYTRYPHMIGVGTYCDSLQQGALGGLTLNDRLFKLKLQV